MTDAITEQLGKLRELGCIVNARHPHHQPMRGRHLYMITVPGGSYDARIALANRIAETRYDIRVHPSEIGRDILLVEVNGEPYTAAVQARMALDQIILELKS